jgi:hypothetical protein
VAYEIEDISDFLASLPPPISYSEIQALDYMAPPEYTPESSDSESEDADNSVEKGKGSKLSKITEQGLFVRRCH